MIELNRLESSPRIGIAGGAVRVRDVRVSGQVLDTPTGRYAVLVGTGTGTGTENVETTVFAAAIGLAVAAPLVIAAAALATYVLVRRSLRWMEAIRSRVADISASDLTERVPVPPHRTAPHRTAPHRTATRSSRWQPR